MHAIPPPPRLCYKSADDAEAAIHEWTLAHKYNVSRLTNTENERLFACDRHGRPRNNHNLEPKDRKRRMRASKKIGCKMRVKVVRFGCEWWVCYTADGSTMHNHEPSTDVRTHASHRKRATHATMLTQHSTTDWILMQSSVGVTAGSVHASLLLADPNTLVTHKDISNAKGIARSQRLREHTAMEELFHLLHEHGFVYEYATDPDTAELRYLFWAHPTMTKYYREWPGVVINDSTYSTNKYGMPLFNIVAVTGLNESVTIGQCWLPGEGTQDYTWALKALRRLQDKEQIPRPDIVISDRAQACLSALDGVFPTVSTMLCHWHLNNNVLARTRKVFKQIRNPRGAIPKYRDCPEAEAFMTKFRETVNSSTVSAFDANCMALRAMSEELAQYLNRHWWPYKEKIVRCWTDSYRHRGYLDTSIVEGTHATMKRWLPNSRGDLLGVFQSLLPWWASRLSKISLSVAYNSSRTPNEFQKPIYEAVVRIITVHALQKTHIQTLQAHDIITKRRPRTQCTGVFRRVHGRPCVHELIEIFESRRAQRLLPSHFDKHWWVKPVGNYTTGARILEPSKRRRRTQPEALNHGSNMGMYRTRRVPTWSERVDRNHPAPEHDFTRQLHSDSNRLAASEHDEELSFEDAFTPARRWGYAGPRR